MEYKMELDVSTKTTLSISLYKDVKNTGEIRKQLMDGTLKCCILKANLIVDPFIIALAANKALTVEKMTTKSVYTEILFNLSISKNISHSLQHFGIADNTNHLIVAALNGESELSEIDGERIDISALCPLRDLAAIKKTYKLNDYEMESDPLAAICNKIAIKDFS